MAHTEDVEEIYSNGDDANLSRRVTFVALSAALMQHKKLADPFGGTGAAPRPRRDGRGLGSNESRESH